jgi:DNA repair protein RecO (recombination protein O)
VTIVATDALVLHAFDYRETSRIVRLLTREAGALSVVARGARRPKNRFGAALDLFATGVAQVAMHGEGDLHALNGFDVTHSRGALAASLDRFAGASAIAEICIRFGRESDAGAVFATATETLDEIAAAGPPEVAAVALRGAWRLVSDLGFAPAVETCALCHSDLADDEAPSFHHRAGGAVCARCARQARGGGRVLPPEARHMLAGWLRGDVAVGLDPAAARSHARLLREFLEEHLNDGRPLRAFVAWEARLAHHAPAPRHSGVDAGGDG